MRSYLDRIWLIKCREMFLMLNCCEKYNSKIGKSKSDICLQTRKH